MYCMCTKRYKLTYICIMNPLLKIRFTISVKALTSIGVYPGVFGCRNLQILGCKVVGSPLNFIISYNVREYEMKHIPKCIDFSEIERVMYIK